MKEEMYLLVCVYDSVAEKKSILSLYIFFSQTSPWQRFGWANRLMARAQGWRFLGCVQGSGRSDSLTLAVGLA